MDVQEIRTPGLLVANDIGNPIRHSVATIYIKQGCSQMENLENRLIISCPKRFRHDEIATRKERPLELATAAVTGKTQLPRPCETLPLAEAMKIASASVTTNHEMNQLLVIFLAPGSHTATDLLK